MNSFPTESNPAKPQAGMVLLLCLLFLTALTLLGLSASADAVLQNQLAANLQESERTKQAALAALSWAEDWLLDLQGPAPESCTTPCEGFRLHPAGDLPPHLEFEDLSWWQTQGYEAGIDPLTGNRLVTIGASSIDPPMWVIEVLHERPTAGDGTTDSPIDAPADAPTDPPTDPPADIQAWYHILARASGQTDSVISVVESIVTRSWLSAEESSDESTSSAGKGRVSWRELR